MEKKFTEDDINRFLNGHDNFEHITNIECSYDDEEVSIIYNKDKRKLVRKEPFLPFVWAKNSVCIRMFDGNRDMLKKVMAEFKIKVKKLINTNSDGNVPSERLQNGYKYMFYAAEKMSYQRFMKFFIVAGTPIYPKNTANILSKDKEFLAISPVEQYMIASGRRLFKGYENYDDVKRLIFDLETQGLNPKIHAISQIGIRTNKGFEKIITIVGEGRERLVNEYNAIKEFIEIVRDEKPDVVIGHNSENFDWNFIIVRLEVLGTTIEDLSLECGFRFPIYKKKKDSVLKLGGETEYYRPTVIWGMSVVDSLHAVRRAQAIDSNMKSANLKYITKYLDLNKQNRVYVKGDVIDTTWQITDEIYAFNNEDGTWYQVDDKHPLKENYELKSGRYIVERYLLDDIWETDKVELKLNESNFLISKILPTTFQRACTMGTAGIWKLITLAWCYENNLAVPSFGVSKRFTGGLSRLLRVGYADRVVKLDYNSLYPSIILTWHIASNMDITNSMLLMLEYVLTQREKYKELKGKYGKIYKKIKKQLEGFQGTNDERKKLIQEMNEAKELETANDKKQLPLKILGNSFFGSFGAEDIYPMGDVTCAEETTCVGRMSLRLMINRFTNLGYTPIVGDSFTSDTPLFVKYNKNNRIDIKPISEIIDESQIKIDELNREYDYSVKPYKVLCRSGWEDIRYVYRHKTDKDIYEVKDGEMLINVTEDHSLFNNDKVKIKPSEINENTELEYYTKPICENNCFLSEKEVKKFAKYVGQGIMDRIPSQILNSNKENKELFLKYYNEFKKDDLVINKTCLAGLFYLNNCVK